MRAWIKQGFKLTQRAGWQWPRTQMIVPQRAACLGLAVAVATRWRLTVGGLAEETIPTSLLPGVTLARAGQRRQRQATRSRLVSVFRRSWSIITAALLEQAPLPLGCFLPEPWPVVSALDLLTMVSEWDVHHQAT